VNESLRAAGRRIWEAALARVQPETLLAGAVNFGAPGAPKSSTPNSGTLLGDHLTDGLIITKEGHAGHPLERLQVLESAHPLPDMRSLAAGQRIAAFLRGGRPTDLVLLLLTGGASALALLPRPPVSLADLALVTDFLLRAGATIHELNVVRKHLDLLKGGGLLRLAAPARVAALLLSDVVGDGAMIDGDTAGRARADPHRADRDARERPGNRPRRWREQGMRRASIR